MAVVIHAASTGITLGLSLSSFHLDKLVKAYIVAGVFLHVAATFLYFWTALIDTTDVLHVTNEATLEMFCDRCNVWFPPTV